MGTSLVRYGRNSLMAIKGHPNWPMTEQRLIMSKSEWPRVAPFFTSLAEEVYSCQGGMYERYKYRECREIVQRGAQSSDETDQACETFLVMPMRRFLRASFLALICEHMGRVRAAVRRAKESVSGPSDQIKTWVIKTLWETAPVPLA